MYTQLTVPYLVPSLLWTHPYIWISHWQSWCDTMFQNYFVPHTFVFTINLVYFYLTLSACKYFQVPGDWQVTHKFLTHSSESPIGWNLHGSRYAFFIRIPVAVAVGHPQVHLCYTLVAMFLNWFLILWKIKYVKLLTYLTRLITSNTKGNLLAQKDWTTS